MSETGAGGADGEADAEAVEWRDGEDVSLAERAAEMHRAADRDDLDQEDQEELRRLVERLGLTDVRAAVDVLKDRRGEWWRRHDLEPPEHIQRPKHEQITKPQQRGTAATESGPIPPEVDWSDLRVYHCRHCKDECINAEETDPAQQRECRRCHDLSGKTEPMRYEELPRTRRARTATCPACETAVDSTTRLGPATLRLEPCGHQADPGVVEERPADAAPVAPDRRGEEPVPPHATCPVCESVIETVRRLDAATLQLEPCGHQVGPEVYKDLLARGA